MSYTVRQYNHPESADDGFLTLTTAGTAKRRAGVADSEVTGSGGINFKDECVQITGGLTKDVNYYFHGKIKRMSTTQTFDIKLVNYSDSKSDVQYIKTIDILSGKDSEWVSVDFIFTPAANFDTIVFELRRIREDFSETQPRFPIIIYQELSIVNNIISTHLFTNETEVVELTKIGVQSHPGLMMCINGEQIYIGKTGIYELRNGVVKATMFSVVNPAVENTAAAGGVNLEEVQKLLTDMGADPNFTTSRCIFNSPKKRTIDAFTLDYMYERED